MPGVAVERLLGTGGFSTVWAATVDGLPNTVAIKVGKSRTADAKRRFAAEAEAIRSIGPPAVPQLYSHGVLPDGRPYLVLEKLTAHTLANRLEAVDDSPDLRWVRGFAQGLFDSVEAAHQAGVAHLDLKPENIFIADGFPPRAVLIDFGLVVRLDGDDKQTSVRAPAAGSLLYMSPEQLRGDPDIGAAADIYGLGVILFELLTLRPPFAGEPAAVEHGHLSLRPPRPSRFASMSESLEELILDCLAKSPDKRPPDIAAVSARFRNSWTEPSRTTVLGESRLLSEDRQPVVLVYAETTSRSRELSNVVETAGAFIARRRGNKAVAAFSAMQVENPISSAVELGRRIVVELSGRVAIEVASLPVKRRKSGPPMVLGTPVEKPESWLPVVDWSGLIVSEKVVELAPELVTEPLPGSAHFASILSNSDSEVGAAVERCGRLTEMSAIAASSAEAFESRTPVLFTAIGASGVGKSRLAAEAETYVSQRWPSSRVIRLRGGREAAGPGDTAAKQLRRRLEASGVSIAQRETAGLEHPMAEAITEFAAGSPLAVILDDAERASDELLDELEYATIAASGPVWVAVFAGTDFEMARPSWGLRSDRNKRINIGPLEHNAAVQLAAALLRPAEYPAVSALEQLTNWTGNNPALLVNLIAKLKKDGAVVKRANAESYYLATAALEALPTSPAQQWIATRELDAMSDQLAACTRVCSVLGGLFAVDELAFVLDHLELQGQAGATVDPAEGARELCRTGVLVEQGRGYLGFRSASLRKGVLALLSEEDQRAVHQHAAVYWRGVLELAADDQWLAEHSLGQLGAHAHAIGDNEQAVTCFIKLAEQAAAEQRHTAADQNYSRALDCIDEKNDARAAALLGRARARGQLDRTGQALEDLAAATSATGVSDRLRAELLLQEATIADMAHDVERAARCTAEAEPLAVAANDPALAMRFTMASARASFRGGELETAIAGFESVVGSESADYETRIIALVLLAPALVLAGRLDEAEARYEEAMRITNASSDWLHLCAVRANRIFLWSAKREPVRAIEDLREAVRLAREAGHAGPERVATHNLAELLYWRGNALEATRLAMRSKLLHERFHATVVPEDAALLARIATSLHNDRRVEKWLQVLDLECPPHPGSPTALLVDAVRLATNNSAAADPTAAWDALLDKARDEAPAEELLELLWLRHHEAKRSQRLDEAKRALAEARERVDAAPIWSERLAAVDPLA